MFSSLSSALSFQIYLFVDPNPIAIRITLEVYFALGIALLIPFCITRVPNHRLLQCIDRARKLITHCLHGHSKPYALSRR